MAVEGRILKKDVIRKEKIIKAVDVKIEMIGRETRITYQRLEDNLQVEGMMEVDKLKMADKSGEEGTVMVMMMRLLDREMALMEGMVMMMRVVDREMTLIEGMDMLRMVDKKMDYVNVKQQGKVVVVDKRRQVLLEGDN